LSRFLSAIHIQARFNNSVKILMTIDQTVVL